MKNSVRKKQVAFYLYESEHNELKEVAIHKGVSVNELLAVNAKKLIAKHKKENNNG